jgi:hypothetical protein
MLRGLQSLVILFLKVEIIISVRSRFEDGIFPFRLCIAFLSCLYSGVGCGVCVSLKMNVVLFNLRLRQLIPRV